MGRATLLSLPSGCGGGGSDPAPAVASNAAARAPHSYAWSELTPQTAFAGRDGAGLLEFNGRLWLLGGWSIVSNPDFYDLTTSEVWSSTDGISWTLETIAPWEGRHMAGWAVFHELLFVVGGDNNRGHYQNDVWSSPDGKNWTQIANAVPWGSARPSLRRGFQWRAVRDRRPAVAGTP